LFVSLHISGLLAPNNEKEWRKVKVSEEGDGGESGDRNAGPHLSEGGIRKRRASYNHTAPGKDRTPNDSDYYV
jgi:hypothetical protein